MSTPVDAVHDSVSQKSPSQDSQKSPSQDLSQLAPGKAGIVRRIRGERRTVVRLLEMGLVPGTRVEVKRKAPLGDPLELRVRGYTLSIRRSEAAGVEVSDVGDAAPARKGAARKDAAETRARAEAEPVLDVGSAEPAGRVGYVSKGTS